MSTRLALGATAALVGLAAASAVGRRGSRGSRARVLGIGHPSLERMTYKGGLLRAHLGDDIIGTLQVTRASGGGDELVDVLSPDCMVAVEGLWRLLGGERPVYFSSGLYVAPQHRRRGVAVRMYESMLDHLGSVNHGPVVLVPEGCHAWDGGTTDDGLRVWKSLSRRYENIPGSWPITSRKKGASGPWQA